MMSPEQLEAEKRRLRGEARARRAAIPAEERARAAEAVARLGLDFLQVPPGLAAAYHPVRGEFDCLPLLRRLAGDGWSLALPVVAGAGPLVFRAWTPGAPLEAGPFGIPQIGGGPAVAPDVLLVPLLAFDAQCHRLGYGGGYYDRTLAALRRGKGATAVGLAFDEQRVAQLAYGAHDEPLDWILTPSGPLRPLERA